MVYQHTNSRGQTYYLHFKDVMLRSGHKQRIYYFAWKRRDGQTLDALSAGFEVREFRRSRRPYCRKKRS
ncbi:MAG: hypothetical protein CL878_04070 [Dehalococcoidia bacterium]|nr:hypothetical protein [Dehalococcoidia bacterium]